MLLAGSAAFILEHIYPQVAHARGSMLAIARMSMNWNPDELAAMLRSRSIDHDPAALDAIRRMLAAQRIYTSREFFKLLGFERYDDVDFDEREGCNIQHDLNQLLPQAHHGAYDFVFENGTLEHIFDVKNAIASIALAAREGGHVLHISPLDAFNHGFYNFSINFFADFYRANGFAAPRFYMLRYSSNWQTSGGQAVTVTDLPYTHEEFQVNPQVYATPQNKLALGVLARKEKHVWPPRTPVQAAYDPQLRLNSRLNSW